MSAGAISGGLWSLFAQLLPSDPLRVGAVVDVVDGGAALVLDTADGGRVRVRTEAGADAPAVGSKVFYKAVSLQAAGQAPDLPAVDLEV